MPLFSGECAESRGYFDAASDGRASYSLSSACSASLNTSSSSLSSSSSNSPDSLSLALSNSGFDSPDSLSSALSSSVLNSPNASSEVYSPSFFATVSPIACCPPVIVDSAANRTRSESPDSPMKLAKGLMQGEGSGISNVAKRPAREMPFSL